MKRTTKQQGFTLIELMIVVAVIGVLAAVALPQYQKYVAKSETASALATLSGLKTNTETYTLENGTFPDQTQSSAVGIPASPMGSIVLAPETGTSGAGSITYTFTSGNVSQIYQEKAFVLLGMEMGTGLVNELPL
ncbi:type IV pilin PilA [Vibrio maritimus]|uniref:Type IV pilin PilA n=1 Tax=Vibrio maritimus TaxID=990268 RepID=A0A090T8P6_9VIBR|nr:type IV pilin PilA [Vibrio maritimus]